ncbi:MAG: hypothetical protein IJG82_08445 [Atopobiaceae bacterium]|nr:hypothetical protein [Atopobiaceae bacterium]
MKKYRSIALLVSVLAICLGLIACAASDKRREVGFNTDVATDVIVANGLDQEITTLGYGNLEEGWSVEFDLQEGDQVPLAVDEECHLFMENEGKPVDILVTCADGTAYEIPSVPVQAGMSVRLVVADGIAYAEYTDAEGNTGNTKDAALERKAKLETEEADMAAADAVLELASALPEGDALTLDAEDAIVAARKAYDELTEDQKHLVTSEAALQMIEAAEQGLQAAKDAEAARIAAEEAAAEESSYEEDYSYSYDDYSYDYGYDDYSAPSQSEDECLDEPVYRN